MPSEHDSFEMHCLLRSRGSSIFWLRLKERHSDQQDEGLLYHLQKIRHDKHHILWSEPSAFSYLMHEQHMFGPDKSDMGMK